MHRYAQVSGLIFALVSALQFVRALRGWPVQIGDRAIPVSVSVLVCVVAAAMAVWAFRISKGAT